MPLNETSEQIVLPTDNQPETPIEETDRSNNTETQTPQEPIMTEPSVTQKKPYTKFIMLSPLNQATIQNQPTISVELGIDPPLQKGDMIQIYLDGRMWGAPGNSPYFEFLAPERGTHQISAKLIDEKGAVLKETSSNTVFIHQAHIPTSPPVKN